MTRETISAAFDAIPGDTAVAIRALDGSFEFFRNEHMPLIAASVIKLAVMLEACRRFEDGTLSKDEIVSVRPEDKKPSCGALTYMHDGVQATLLDLVTLMIIVSDNTATNLMIDRLGIDNVNSTLDSYGLSGIRLRRKLFDPKNAARGIQNTVTAASVLKFYELLYEGALVSKKASDEMLRILLNQRLNSKMPFFLHPMDIDVAHKTGEDDGVTHDTGIIFTPVPCAAVFLSNNVDVPVYERFIQDACLALAK